MVSQIYLVLIFSSVKQASFLFGKRRLSARPLDWLLWKMYTKLIEASRIKANSKEAGVIKNMKAYHSINQCILTAKQQAESAMTFASSGQIFMESSSESGTVHSVTVTEETASCSCRAVNICSHIIKVLMLKGASEKCLLQHLGIHWGRSIGGFVPVMQAIKARAHETSALAPEVASGSLQNDPAVATELEQHEGIVRTLPLHASADVASRRGTRLQTEQAKAFAAVDELRALGASWESENWTIHWYHVLAAANAVEKATGKPAQHCDPTAQLHTNPYAPEGNSSQRLLSFVDGGPS